MINTISLRFFTWCEHPFFFVDETEPLGKYTTGNDPLDIPKTPKQNIPYDPNSCSVTGCSVSSKTNPTMRFYAIPVSTNNAPASYQHIENKRRLAWFEGVDLKVEAKRFNSMRICANHFRYGTIYAKINTHFVPISQLSFTLHIYR